MQLNHQRISFLLSLMLLGAFFTSRVSFAQEPAAKDDTQSTQENVSGEELIKAEEMSKAKEEFKKGKELFDEKDFENAVDHFKESYKLSKNPILLYNVAFTHDEIGDGPMAILYYEKFLKDSDKSAANRNNAKKRLRALRKANTPTKDEDLKTITSFKHTVIDESPPNTPLDIVATVPEGVPWRVVLNYRTAGQAKFIAVEMKYRFKELVARIPVYATRSKNVQYYIEVKDGLGKVLERSGQPTSPHIVYMDKDAKARFYSDTPSSDFTPVVSAKRYENDRGWLTPGSSKFNKLKWIATGGTAGILLISATTYMLSSTYNNDLETESTDSRSGSCGVPPCKRYAQKQKDLQSLGQTYETIGTIAMGIGVTTAAAAAALWYMDLTNTKSEEERRTSSMPAYTPLIGKDFVGASASLQF